MDLELTDGDETMSDRTKVVICFGVSSDDDDVDDVFEAPRVDGAAFRDFSHELMVRKEIDWLTSTSRQDYPGYVLPATSTPTFLPEVEINQNEEMIHKTILVGDSGVGKTSILVQFDTGKFHPSSFAATVGIGFTNKLLSVDGTRVKLQIWDTAGQERFRSVTHAYYRDAHALLLLYDVTNRKSFDNTRAWLAEINEYAHHDVIIMLLGNKCDCAQRVVQREDGERLAREYNVNFMETSAKTGLNVEQTFIEVARALKEKRKSVAGQKPYDVKEFVEPMQWTSRNSCGSCGYS